MGCGTKQWARFLGKMGFPSFSVLRRSEMSKLEGEILKLWPHWKVNIARISRKFKFFVILLYSQIEEVEHFEK